MRIDNHLKESEVDGLLDVYTELKKNIDEKNNSVILSGKISVNRSYNNYTIDKDYKIKILIPLNSCELPEVWDIGNHIDPSYAHIYPDGKLCLETDAYIALCFYNGFNLLDWMKNIVEPYFYSYEYYSNYDEFPFGERGHDFEGVIEAYQEIFNEQDVVKVFKLLHAISKKKYKGHLLCPCNSGLITRKCHGEYIFHFFHNERLHHIAHRDYTKICEVINEYDK